MITNVKPSNAGHRSRLREKFLKNGIDSFLDYEVLELLLTLGTPRKDCKQIAKDLLKKYKNINSVFDSNIEELQQIKGIGPSNAFGIKLFQEIAEKYYKTKIDSKISLESPVKIFEFLRFKIGNDKKENLVVLFFDTKNNLIVKKVSVGTLNANISHPREIFNSAIINNASHIVIAHNHPSGNPSPSAEDIDNTKKLVEASKIIGIPIIDHIIICRNDYYSFKNNGQL